MAIFGLIIAIIIALFSVPCALGMMCTYIISDPFNYYFIVYRKSI